MSSDTRERNAHQQPDDPTPNGRIERRPYSPPRLAELGDVRDLTLGGSPGGGDTVNPLLTKPPGA